MNKFLNIFLRFVLRKTDAHRHIKLLTAHRGEGLFLQFRLDPFRRDDSFFSCGHRQHNRKFLAAVAVSRVNLAQTSLHHLAELR